MLLYLLEVCEVKVKPTRKRIVKIEESYCPNNDIDKSNWSVNSFKNLEVLNEEHMFSTSVNHPSWDKTEDYGIKIIMAKLRGSLPSIMLVYRTPLVDTSIENIYCETLWV